MNIYRIYMATNLFNNKVYIGYSSNFQKRVKEHYNAALIKNSALYFHRAIRLYGWENFKWEILYQSNDKNHTFNIMETHFIRKYRSFINYDDCNGYNMTEGGGNICDSNEVIEKIRNRVQKEWDNMPEDIKIARFEKMKNTKLNWSQEQKDAFSKICSDIRTTYYIEESLEEKMNRIEKAKDVYANLTQDQKDQIKSKRKVTVDNWPDDKKKLLAENHSIIMKLFYNNNPKSIVDKSESSLEMWESFSEDKINEIRFIHKQLRENESIDIKITRRTKFNNTWANKSIEDRVAISDNSRLRRALESPEKKAVRIAKFKETMKCKSKSN